LWQQVLLPLVLVLHGGLLFDSVLGQGDIRLGFGNSISTIFWLSAVIYWLASYGTPVAWVQVWVNGLAALSLLLLLFFPASHVIPNSHTLALRAHLVVAFLAYGLLAVAALHAAMMTALEKRLHRGGLFEGGAPPLLTLESVLFRTIGAGFLLLTLAVSSGVFFSEMLFGQPLQFNHKVVFGILSWFVFGGLLLGRHFRGWRGRIALYWTLTGFVLLLFAYVGTQFVLEVLLGR
jgi:ABC-type uncharacterized transport system permease subunit